MVNTQPIQKQNIDSLPGEIAERYRSFLPKTFAFPLSDYDTDWVRTFGKNGGKERHNLALHHHFQVLKEPNAEAQILRDAEMLTSRIADREMQKGEVYHLSDGFFYVDELFVGGGAYVSVLRDFEGNQVPKIICRGTPNKKSSFQGFCSLLNNVSVELGSMGTKAIFPKLSAYLKKESVSKVQLLGKSLGGAHAQHLALLFEGLEKIEVEKLTTVCSVGVGSRITKLFNEKVLKERVRPFSIHVIRNGEKGPFGVDFVPAVGGHHLGYGADQKKCLAKVTYIGSKEPEGFPLKMGKLKMLQCFKKCFGSSHRRQMTLRNFQWKEINGDQLEAHLKVGTFLEGIRKVVAYVLHFLTLFLLNGRSLSISNKRHRCEC